GVTTRLDVSYLGGHAEGVIMKVSVELGDDVLRMIDGLASRSGRPRDEIIAEAVRQQALRQRAATRVLSDLLAGLDDGLSDDDAAASWRRSVTLCTQSSSVAAGNRARRWRRDRTIREYFPDV